MKYAHKTYYGVWEVFHIDEDGTRLTDSGTTRDEAVIHSLEQKEENYIEGQEKTPKMMYLNDYKTYISNYLSNCGQNQDKWDIEGAENELYDKLDGASPEDLSEYEFIKILLKYEV